MPRSQEDWEAEFAKYRASPEFRLAHSHMTVEDFKFIFFMEYAHRMWGRLLGLVFAVPAAVFAARRVIPRPLASRLGLLFFMGGTQGLVGWWMVRSGLQVGRVTEGEKEEEGAGDTAREGADLLRSTGP
jgi:cytochrome c oxidase assembly protein subunit 15